MMVVDSPSKTHETMCCVRFVRNHRHCLLVQPKLWCESGTIDRRWNITPIRLSVLVFDEWVPNRRKLNFVTWLETMPGSLLGRIFYSKACVEFSLFIICGNGNAMLIFFSKNETLCTNDYRIDNGELVGVLYGYCCDRLRCLMNQDWHLLPPNLRNPNF